MAEFATPPRFRAVVVIPVYNHASGIAYMIDGVRQAGLRCVLVDDGSDPACAALLDHLSRANAQAVSIVRLPLNRGKGAAVTAGMHEAARQGYSHALQIDADGQHDVADIARFIARARRQPNAVICGCPSFDATAPKVRRVARYATHVWVWINTLSFDIGDSMCGLRVYPLASALALLDEVRLSPRMAFDPEILVRLHWRGVPIVNLRTRITYPAGGVSHFRLVLDNWLISLTHARLFFGMLRRAPTLMRRRWPPSKARQ
jgi:glycosyltransferase involved in cell wall biosynthesis